MTAFSQAMKDAVTNYQPLRPRMLALDPRQADPAPVSGAPLTRADTELLASDVLAPLREQMEKLVRQARPLLRRAPESVSV